MADLVGILSDLNVTIADIETLKAQNDGDCTKAHQDHMQRAIGQLKAARTSIVHAMRDSTRQGDHS